MDPDIREHAKRGLAAASKETKLRVARKGGIAPHNLRGLAAADSETRSRVAKAGGDARAQDKEGLRYAGRKGGQAVKAEYGIQFYHSIGEKGGESVKEKYGIDFYREIG
jgi:general stress protein YciG